jgi:cell division protein FtsI/penicillin-binding protein 2
MDSLYATVRQNRALMKAGTPPTPPFGAHVGCGTKGCLPGFVNVGAVLENPANGAILAMYSGPNYNGKGRTPGSTWRSSPATRSAPRSSRTCSRPR